MIEVDETVGVGNGQCFRAIVADHLLAMPAVLDGIADTGMHRNNHGEKNICSI